MSRESNPKNSRNRDFWRAVRFLGPYRALVIRSIVCAMIAGALMTFGIPAMVPILKVLIHEDTFQSWANGVAQAAGPNPPFYIAYLQEFAAWMPSDKVETVAILFVIIAIVAFVGNIFRLIYEYSSDKAVISAVNDVRRTYYDHIIHLPLGFFGLQGTSDVTSRLVSDCLVFQEGLKICLGQSVLDVVRAILALTAALIIDWRLTVFIVLSIPLMGAVIKKFGKKMRRASRAALRSNSAMLGQIEGSLSGIRVVKAANAERFERRRYSRIMQNLLVEQLKMAWYDALSTPVLETLATWGAGVVLIFATYLMFGKNVQHRLNPDWFIPFMTTLIVIGESIRKLSKLNSVLQQSHSAAARIFETLDIAIERPRRAITVNESRLIKLDPIQRDVRFESVTFAYPNTSAAAVTDVELVVPKGKSVAIVGRNGSGKTTLMAMLPRFYDPDRGRVTIDGVDLRKATLRSLRQQISVVTQDSVVFPGTVAENIAYGHPLSSRLNDGSKGPTIDKLREQIEHAARRAFAHDFIMEKPQGYDASLDGLGGQLSGGQKQRLNIARAILRQAPILILDEATSQVDAESEHLIQQAIESLMHERTTFVIAHRFSTILSADWIVVMERGRIVGQGQHEELLKNCETYQQLYERQLIAAPV